MVANADLEDNGYSLSMVGAPHCSPLKKRGDFFRYLTVGVWVMSAEADDEQSAKPFDSLSLDDGRDYFGAKGFRHSGNSLSTHLRQNASNGVCGSDRLCLCCRGSRLLSLFEERNIE